MLESKKIASNIPKVVLIGEYACLEYFIKKYEAGGEMYAAYVELPPGSIVKDIESFKEIETLLRYSPGFGIDFIGMIKRRKGPKWFLGFESDKLAKMPEQCIRLLDILLKGKFNK